MNKDLDDLSLVYKNLKPIPRSIDEAFKTPAYACAVTVYGRSHCRFLKGLSWYFTMIALVAAMSAVWVYTT